MVRAIKREGHDCGCPRPPGQQFPNCMYRSEYLGPTCCNLTKGEPCVHKDVGKEKPIVDKYKRFWFEPKIYVVGPQMGRRRELLDTLIYTQNAQKLIKAATTPLSYPPRHVYTRELELQRRWPNPPLYPWTTKYPIALNPTYLTMPRSGDPPKGPYHAYQTPYNVEGPPKHEVCDVHMI